MPNETPDPSSSGGGSADDPEERKTGHGCLTAIGLLMVLACLLVGGAVVGFRWYLTRTMPPSEIAEMRRFMTEPVDFPAEWAKADPYDPLLLAAEADVVKIWDARGATIIRHTRSPSGVDVLSKAANGEALSDDERATLTLLATDSESFVDECSRTVVLAGYEAGVSEPGLNTTNFLGVQIGAKAACAKAHVLAASQQWDSALDYALLPLRRAQRHPASGLIHHLIAVACQSIALKSIATLASDCPDPQPLRRTLDDLNQMRDRLNLNVLEQGDLIDWVAQLRSYKRAGYPVDLAPGKPKIYYMLESMDATMAFHRWMVDRLPSGDPRRTLYQSMIPKSGSSLGGIGTVASPLAFRIMRTLFPEMLYRIGRPNIQEAHIREKVAQAQYDLVRLHLAERIAELEGKTPPTAAADHVPASLPEEPMDPFSGASFLRDAASGSFYSVGPDAGNDKLGELYDPTNGTMSRGDVAVRK